MQNLLALWDKENPDYDDKMKKQIAWKNAIIAIFRDRQMGKRETKIIKSVSVIK